MSTAVLRTLPVAVIPIVIYLIFRWRRRDVEWGSMYVLRRVLETKSRLRAWMQYVCLALRTLALVAVVLAVAGPTGWKVPLGEDVFPAPPPATHRVVLLDTSASMAARHEVSTRLETALGLCRMLARSGVSPGRLDILPLTGHREPVMFAGFPIAAARVEEALTAVAGPSGSADLAAGLRRAEELFRGTASEHRELFVVSDFAAVNVVDPAVTDEIAAALTRIRSEGVAIQALRTQAADTRNYALLEFTAHADTILAGQPTLFHVKVGFSGAVADGETILRIEADPNTPRARLLHEQSLSMTPGETEVNVPLVLPAGRHAIRASVGPDDLAFDDALTRVFTAAGSVRVMLVQDVGTDRGFDDPRTWLDIALAARTGPPTTNGAADGTGDGEPGRPTKGADAAHVEILLEGKIPEQLSAGLLEQTDIVIVSSIAGIDAHVVELLRRFALRGGLVLLAPRPGQDPESFNDAWAGLTPAAIGAPRWPDVDPERHESCAAEDTGLPLWRELESPTHGNLANARFYNHFALSPGPLPDGSATLLALTDGDRLLVERRLGRGGVMLWTAGLTHEWHSLVVHPGFPVMLLRLVGLAADRRRFETNVAPGEPLVMPTTMPQVKVIRPDRSEEIVATVARGEARFVRYDRTDLPGTYDIREDMASESPGMIVTVSAVGHLESDLEPTAAAIQARLEEAAGADWRDTAAKVAAASAADYPGPSWVLPFALAMLTALVGEAAISRWFLS